MRKRFLTICVTTVILSLTACGQSAGSADNTTDNEGITEEVIEESAEDEEPTEISDTPIETANIIDEIWLNSYDKEFMESDDYNPLFDKRCFYVKGIKIHIPNTVRDFERLFGTEFTSAMHPGYDTIYKDDKDRTLQVEFTASDRDKLRGDTAYDDKLKDVPIIGVYYDDSSYGKEHSILNLNEVSFEPVPQEGKYCANEYGYVCNANLGEEDKTVYRFYPACYQAYYEFLNGNLPSEYIEDGLDRLPEMVDVQYGDVTLDALDEMFYFTDDEVCVITYDSIDRKLRLLYRTGEIDSISTEVGILIYEYDPEGPQDYYGRTEYYVFNRYGKEWKLAELERWQDDNKHHTLNGEEVDEDTYIEAARLYGHAGAFDSQGIDLTVWGFRSGDRNSKFAAIMEKKAALDLEGIGYDPDEKRETAGNVSEEEESIDGDYDTLRSALIEAGFDVDTYGLGGFDVVVAAPDGYVNVREGCGLEFDVVRQIPNGETVSIGDCHVDMDKKLWGEIKGSDGLECIALSQVQQVR